jgi:hypothetical protein
MKKVYRSALGKPIDMDNIRLRNEDIIAVGNMKVNARGDELGPGGKVVKTRNQVMNDYYRLNTPTVTTTTPLVADDSIIATEAAAVAETSTLRGSLAGDVEKTAKNLKKK